MPGLITLLTDFGTADGYVAEMKGVVYSAVPGVHVVDISHDIPPQDVELARLTLARYWRRFPEGTVHVVVVDPGVGSARAALAVECEQRILIGPDNGVLSAALLVPGARAVTLPVPAGASPTFHGRDVFAPAAGAVAAGAAIDSLGVPCHAPVVHRTPEAVREADGAVRGTIIAIDRFGNAITNLAGVRGGTVTVGATTIPLRHTYAEVDSGALLALVGSSGLLEIAVRDGNAAATLGLERGGGVRWRPAR